MRRLGLLLAVALVLSGAVAACARPWAQTVLPPPGQPAAGPAAGLLMEDRFTDNRSGWPSDGQSTAWIAEDGYHLHARDPGRFVAVSVPTSRMPAGSASLRDVSVTATFRKVGGPAGGGYGVIVRDQEPAARDGVSQDGRYYVLEVGDRGEVGIWRRERERWVELVPWTFSDAVRPGDQPNELVVQAAGADLTLLVNGTVAARVHDATLESGAVGVFAGGDLNEVVLQRLAVHALTPAKPVNVEGLVQPLTHARLSFQVTGRVRSVVEADTPVQAGDVIAQLETVELELALRAAMDDLALARAQEAQARDGALPEQVAASGAGVRAAQSKLEEVLAGPREAERRAAEAAVEQAAARLQDARAKQALIGAQPKAAEVEAAASALVKAESDAAAAAARLEQLERGGAPEDVAQARGALDRARAEVMAAEASLAHLLAGPPAADVSAARSQVDQARTRLAQLSDAPRVSPQDVSNAELAVQAARAALDKARADAGDGNLVGPGRPLSRQAADAAVRAAELSVMQAQNALDKLRASGPTEWDIRLAQEAVASAQANYDRVTRKPTPEEVAKAEAQVAAARAGLDPALARLQQVERGGTEADLVQARGAAASAQAGVAAAKARLQQVLAGPSEEEKAAAVAAVEAAARDLRSAEARREQVLAGATRAEQEQARSAVAAAAATDAQTRRGATEAAVQVAVARTRRAETAVEQARAALDRATLRAPFAGTVTSISARRGEVIEAGGVAASLADLSQLQIETRDLDESAVARVREGHEVAITVPALGRAGMTGRVVRVSRQPQPTSAAAPTDAYYTATIAIARPHPDLRWGMTVRVEIR